MKLELTNICKFYDTEVGSILDNLDLNIAEKDNIIIRGESGGGKTSLLKILALIDQNFTGSYKINGIDIKNMDQKTLINTRNSISYVFQEYGLMEKESAFYNISLPLLYKKLKKNEITEEVLEISKKLNIEKLLNRKVRSLSGGERQRVALARSLVKKSDIYVADEPFSSLNKEMVENVVNIIEREYGDKQVIFVFHDIPEYLSKDYKIYTLKDKNLIIE